MQPNIDVEDLVRLPNHTLALVERLPYVDDSSSEESSSEEDHLPWSLNNRRTPLISTYEDPENTNSADPHIHDIRFSPNDTMNTRNIPDGYALVSHAFTGELSLHRILDLVLIDRPLERNVTVTSANNPLESATVVDLHKRITVRRVSSITHNTIRKPAPDAVFDVEPLQLGFFYGLEVGDTVVRDVRVGVVEAFTADLYVHFSDGSIALVPTHDEEHPIYNADSRVPMKRKSAPNIEGIFFPGQAVTAPPETWSQNATWIRGAYSNLQVGIVKQVRMRDVTVQWIACRGTDLPLGRDFMEEVPFADLVPLESFRQSSWAVGDRGFLADPRRTTWKFGSILHATIPFDNGKPSSRADPFADKDLDFDLSDSGSNEWLEERDPGPSESNAQRLPQGRLFKAQRRVRKNETVAEYVETDADTIPPEHIHSDDVVQVVRTKTFVTLVWQDGRKEENVPAENLRRNDFIDGNDFKPGEIVIRKDEEALSPGRGRSNTGGAHHAYVVRVNNQEKTAVVRWERKSSDKEFHWGTTEEEISVYELLSDDFDFAIGDTVVQVNDETSERNISEREEWVGIVLGHQKGEATIKWLNGASTKANCKDLVLIHSDAEDDDEEEEETESEFTHTDNDSDAMRYFVDDGETSNSELRQNWGPDSDGEEAEMSLLEKGKSVITTHLVDFRARNFFLRTLTEENMTNAIQVGVEQSARVLEMRKNGNMERKERWNRKDVGCLAGILVLRTNAELLERSFLNPSENTNTQNGREETEEALSEAWEKLRKALFTAFECLVSGDLASESNGNMENNEARQEPSAMEVESNMDDSPSDTVEDAREIEPMRGLENGNCNVEQIGCLDPFGVADELDDFHFDLNANDAPQSSRSQKFLSVISKEWRRLRTSLPEGILVRVCESHDNIVRAAIIGSEGTPYADVIFFFDILMGNRYPLEPPRVWFRSHGRRLNPNLYEDGSVCLSILGTWDGDSVESWDPKTSNLLRVLLSLQAFVFVEEPYYNEAGYGKQKGTPMGRNNSRGYNESIFLLCMKHLVWSLKKQQAPSDCYEMAAKHYSSVGCRILKRCRALIRGEETEQGDSNNSLGDQSSSDHPKPYTSAGFRKSLEHLLQPLQKALNPLIDGTDMCVEEEMK